VWSSPAIVDINGDGHLDVVVGTGTNMPAPAGSAVYAFDRGGNPLPGWPATTGGRVMGSPAVGDITGAGHLDVVVPAEDGRIYAFDRTGHLLPGWPQCNADDRAKCPVTAHGSVALADVAGDGHANVVNAGEQWLRVFGGDAGLRSELPTRSGTTPLTASPTVASVGGKAWVVQAAGFDLTGDGLADIGGVWAWSTRRPLGAAPWPMFRQNVARTGSPVAPPTGVIAPEPLRRAPVRGVTASPSPSAVPRADSVATATTAVPLPPAAAADSTTTTDVESPSTTAGSASALAAPRSRRGVGGWWTVAGLGALLAGGAGALGIRYSGVMSRSGGGESGTL
jgi:hypothetical protein